MYPQVMPGMSPATVALLHLLADLRRISQERWIVRARPSYSYVIEVDGQTREVLDYKIEDLIESLVIDLVNLRRRDSDPVLNPNWSPFDVAHQYLFHRLRVLTGKQWGCSYSRGGRMETISLHEGLDITHMSPPLRGKQAVIDQLIDLVIRAERGEFS